MTTIDKVFIEALVVGGDNKLAPFGHGVTSVQYQIEQGAFELVGVGLSGP